MGKFWTKKCREKNGHVEAVESPAKVWQKTGCGA